jgi:glycerol-3-phosphate O-acyltransferase
VTDNRASDVTPVALVSALIPTPAPRSVQNSQLPAISALLKEFVTK